VCDCPKRNRLAWRLMRWHFRSRSGGISTSRIGEQGVPATIVADAHRSTSFRHGVTRFRHRTKSRHGCFLIVFCVRHAISMTCEYFLALAREMITPFHRPTQKKERVMNTIEKVLYTAKTHTTGGRDGASRSADGRLDVKLSSPGTAGTGTNPEQLFAAGWSACFLSAIAHVASQKKVTLPAERAIEAEVDLRTNAP